MARATGRRTLAGFLIGLSSLPPWIHAVITVPMGLALWRDAKRKENEREQEVAALNNS